jgi:hypothetical protein
MDEALEMVEGRSWAVELKVFDRLEVSQREGGRVGEDQY